MIEPEGYRFEGDGCFPNSPLPLLVYRKALPPSANGIELLFAQHGWTGAWRNGIYSFHHFHSIAHEVLGIAAGSVTVAFGGPNGQTVSLATGDAVVIPAGVAHRNIGSSSDLVVIGAYPGGADWDLCRGDPAAYEACLRAVACVSRPESDPVAGGAGVLMELWE